MRGLVVARPAGAARRGVRGVGDGVAARLMTGSLGVLLVCRACCDVRSVVAAWPAFISRAS